MRPGAKKPFSIKKSDYEEVDALIANAMNNKQPQKGYQIQQSQNDEEQVKNISSRPQFNLRKGADRGRDSPFVESTEENEFTSSQAESTQSQLQSFKPQKMAFKKATGSLSQQQNVIDQLSQNQMQSKNTLKKPSPYDSIKPFAKKTNLTTSKLNSDTNFEENPNSQEQPLSNSILTKPSFSSRPIRKKDEGQIEHVNLEPANLRKPDDEDQVPVLSIKPFDKKIMQNPSRGLKNQPQQQIEQQQILEQPRPNSQTRTINIKKKLDTKIKQQINYMPIQTPIINKEESEEYEQEFDDYVEDKPKQQAIIAAKPNLPIPEKGQIDWKEQERKQKDQEELLRIQREQEEKRRKEEEEERRIQEEKRRDEEERRKDEYRRREIQKAAMINIHQHQQHMNHQDNVPGGLLVGKQGYDKNIFSAQPMNNQLDSYQQNFDQVPAQPSVQQVKAKGKPVLKDKYREDQSEKQQPQQQQIQIETRNLVQANKKGGIQYQSEQLQQSQQFQRVQQQNEIEQQQVLVEDQQYNKKQQNKNQQEFSYAKNEYQEEDKNIYNNFSQKEVKLQPQYDPKGEYIEGDEVKVNLKLNDKKASLAKVEAQQERVKNLRQLIQLELDTFETLFELQPTTDYEIYINKIKAGTLKNSADQSDDNRVTQEIQTDLFQQNEFGNQFPEDQTRTFLKTNVAVAQKVTESMQTQTEPEIENVTKNLDDATKLIEFMNNVYPVFEEILNSEKTNNQNNNENFLSEDIRRYPIPKFILDRFKILGVRTTLNDVKDVYICYDISQEGNEWFRLSLIIKYTNFRVVKYCITQSQVSSLAHSNNILIAGTKEGSLNLWDLRETEFSHLKVSNKYIDAIKEGLEKNESIINSAPTSSKSLANDEDTFEASVAFRFPSFTTDYLVQNANLLLNETESVQHSSSVVKVLINTRNSQSLEFFSLEEFGKVIAWNLLELQQQEAERNYIEFGKYTKIKVISQGFINLSQQIFMNPDSICYDIQLDSEENNLYICSSLGIIKADKFCTNKIKHPRVFGEHRTTSFPTCLFVSNETELLVAGYSDGSIKLFSKNFKDPLLSFTNFTRQKITKIFVNYQTNKSTNKKYHDINRLIASDATGNIFLFDLSINQSSPIKSYQQISQVNISQKKAVSVQNIPDMNGVEIFIQNEQNQISSFKWNYDDLVEKNPKKIYEDMKKLELIVPTYYHNFDFGGDDEILI
ncbi:hypothetical protein ABPG72_007951 [Tetrahymena utriculariae]